MIGSKWQRKQSKYMRAALVYDRVNTFGGAERVLLAIKELIPSIDLVTSVYNPQTAQWANGFNKVKTSFIQNTFLPKDKHYLYPMLMPLAFEAIDLNKYDLVISVSSEYAKGVLTRGGSRHIDYCLTPTRYLWSGSSHYFRNKLLKKIATPIIDYLKDWDLVAASRPDLMIPISNDVKKRIDTYYKRRQGDVLFPPVNVEKLKTNMKRKTNKFGEYFLIVSRLVSYKKVDLAIKAFNRIGKTLVVVGEGRQMNELKRIAKDNIHFLGRVEDQELAQLYHGAVALIFPQIEDFGIVAVESQSVGTPVIALRKGGALDTVVEGETGVFFDRQRISSLVKAVNSFNQGDFSSEKIVKNAERFSKKRFQEEFGSIISSI